MEDNLETYMPGFTHLQKAQPTTLAHHMGAYFEMFKRMPRDFRIFTEEGITVPLEQVHLPELLIHWTVPIRIPSLDLRVQR